MGVRAVTKGRILLAEDDPAVRFGLAAGLKASGYEVLEAASSEDAARSFSASHVDVVLTDIFLSDGNALDLLPRIRAVDPTVPIYIITGQGSVNLAVRAMKEGAEDVLTKPLELSVLCDIVDRAVARRNVTKSGMVRRRKSLQASRSEVMHRLDEEIERLRDADCAVLILGETGTGKSMLARRIFSVGARSQGNLVEVNCAGLSRELVESELFGHERGAFTGAHTQKPGLLETANGGALFLDEIGDIDLLVQPKLLKVLEEKRYRRLGDVRERTADVRLIAATHHDLLSAVAEGRFRADLYYRISTVTVTMPPLRDRVEDIVPLAREILAQHARPIDLARDAEEKLVRYAWPGNIRELKNVIERSLLLRRGDAITAEDIRFDVPHGPAMRAPSSSRLLAYDASAATRDEIEREHILMALDAEHGRVEAAARRLGIPRSTLYFKLKKMGIPGSRTRGSG